MKYLLIFIIVVLVYLYANSTHRECMDEASGQFCPTCQGRTPGQCLQCFNCGYNGSECVKGTFRGPDENQHDKALDSSSHHITYNTTWLHNDNFWRHNMKTGKQNCIN